MLQFCGNVRFVWNHFLAYNTELYEKEKKFLFNTKEYRKLLKELKEEKPFLLLSPFASLDYVIRTTLPTALRDCGKKNKNKKGFPKFKNKHKHNSFYFQETTLKDGKIKIPKLGYVKVVQHQDVEGKITGVTVRKTVTGKWYVSLSTDCPKQVVTPNDKRVAFDWGIRKLLTTYDGRSVEFIENPKFLEQELKKLRRLERAKSRKKKGSNNREKIRLKVAKQHEKVKFIRNDFIHKLTNTLSLRYNTIAMEDISIQELLKGRHSTLNRLILDTSFYEIKRQLAYKLERNGGSLILVPARGTSRTCSKCGFVHEKLGSNETFHCPSCGFCIDRDANAAYNIYNRAFNSTAGSVETEVNNDFYAYGDITVGSIHEDVSCNNLGEPKKFLYNGGVRENAPLTIQSKKEIDECYDY